MNTAKKKLIAELYDQEIIDVMSDAEAETLLRLHREIGQAFDAVCDEYAVICGLENSQLSDEQKAHIIDKVKAMMENYEGTDSDPRYLTPSTQLTACVRRHHHLGLEISKICDDCISRLRQD